MDMCGFGGAQFLSPSLVDCFSVFFFVFFLLLLFYNKRLSPHDVSPSINWIDCIGLVFLCSPSVDSPALIDVDNVLVA